MEYKKYTYLEYNKAIVTYKEKGRGTKCQVRRSGVRSPVRCYRDVTCGHDKIYGAGLSTKILSRPKSRTEDYVILVVTK
jgi:hypothetical protein